MIQVGTFLQVSNVSVPISYTLLDGSLGIVTIAPIITGITTVIVLYT